MMNSSFMLIGVLSLTLSYGLVQSRVWYAHAFGRMLARGWHHLHHILRMACAYAILSFILGLSFHGVVTGLWRLWPQIQSAVPLSFELLKDAVLTGMTWGLGIAT